MEWSINDIVRTAGITSRTLRHYHAIGLLEPSRVASNGYRYYDEACLVRLQRILLLRDLGLGLTDIGGVIAGQSDAATALRSHLALLESERDRIGRQIRSVRTTLTNVEQGRPIVAKEALDGFDHTQYKDEVIEKWGRDAYEQGDRWWRGLSEGEKEAFKQEQLDIATAFAQAHADGEAPDGERAQAITARHYAWVSGGSRGRRVSAEHFAGLGQLYVDDPRFTANYDQHGGGTAAFIRDAMAVYAETELS
ncbi:MerR family transcriptional regulator [Stackebrandtia soli]|uniref:MerR family transcriptional regulator n=1 Tax=Stackebrandtia soli TaxID=1892856 RepID=UPI0039E752DE